MVLKVVRERVGIIHKVVSRTEIILDCSCKVSDELLDIRFKPPLLLFQLKKGDWVKVLMEELTYLGKDFCYEYYTGNAKKIIRTSKVEEIKRLERIGEIDCGWYLHLLNHQ